MWIFEAAGYGNGKISDNFFNGGNDCAVNYHMTGGSRTDTEQG